MQVHMLSLLCANCTKSKVAWLRIAILPGNLPLRLTCPFIVVVGGPARGIHSCGPSGRQTGPKALLRVGRLHIPVVLLRVWLCCVAALMLMTGLQHATDHMAREDCSLRIVAIQAHLPGKEQARI